MLGLTAVVSQHLGMTDVKYLSHNICRTFLQELFIQYGALIILLNNNIVYLPGMSHQGLLIYRGKIVTQRFVNTLSWT